MSPATLSRDEWWECPECMTGITGTHRTAQLRNLAKTPCPGCGRPMSLYRLVGPRKGKP